VTLWESRDLPVLSALDSSENEHIRLGYLSVRGASETLGLDVTDDEIHESILTLGDLDYIEGEFNPESGYGGFFSKLKVTGRGYQVLGQWPFFIEMTPATLATLLERFADEAATEEEADNARKAASYIRSLSGAAVKAALKVAMVEGVKLATGLHL
jgi:hypothetical protein